jgi:hypothetical protein
MPISECSLANLLAKWNDLLERERVHIPDFELSALSSWVKDCHDSYKEIYENLLIRIARASQNDFESLHDSVVEIYWHLDHIKKHILDAEDGLAKLMEILAKKADEETRG